MTSENPWDNLAEYFNTNGSIKSKEEIESNAADNVFIGEPVVLEAVNTYLPSHIDRRALDFGCGTGAFAARLAGLGFQVTGVDSSKVMVENASSMYGAKATFKSGDSKLIPSLGSFSLITSLMTLQFIEDADKTIQDLASALQADGLMVLSVFNPDYARNAYEAGKEFFGFDFSKNPTSGTLEMVGDDKVPTFIRDADYYKHIAEQAGLTPVMEAYPPFTADFLRQYPHPVPTKDPEYMILGFRHKSQ